MTTKTTASRRAKQAADYDRALAAEPQLQAIARMVEVMCATAPTDEPFCASCLWEMVLKPLVSPWVGWERGYPAEQAKDPDPTAGWEVWTRDNLLARAEERPAAGTDTEEWLRSMEAFDAVTDRWLEQLEEADPDQGHGFPRSGNR